MKRRIERGVARHLARVVERLAARARDTLPPDVRVEAVEDALVLTGRRLRARSLTDARLRGVGQGSSR